MRGSACDAASRSVRVRRAITGGKPAARADRDIARCAGRHTKRAAATDSGGVKSMSTQHAGRERYDRLLRTAQALPPVATAVAHPCDRVSLEGVVEAARLGLVEPILVAPPNRIRRVAEEAGLDIAGYPFVESAHSHDSAT